MSEKKHPQSFTELVRLLAQFIRDDEPESDEELHERIRDMGHEPNELATKMRARLNQAIDESPLNWRNQSDRIQRERDVLGRFNETLSGSIDQLKAEITALLRSSQARLAVHHRNLDLDEMTEADLAQLLAELKFQLSEHQESSDKSDEK